MKKIFLIQLLFISINCFGQGADSLITNLNISYGTVKIILYITSPDESNARFLNKWIDEINDNPPANESANVNIDTVRSDFISDCYRKLLSLPAGYTEVSDFIGDFKTSIASKRATNSYFDGLCDALEGSYTTELTNVKNSGRDKAKKK